MYSKPRRTLVAVTAVAAALTTVLGLTVAPAGARVAASNDKFCAIFSAESPPIDFEGLGPDEAKLGAKLFRKAAKAGVPAKLKTDLKKIAKIYDRIAHGEPAIKVLDADTQASVLPRLTRFSKYLAANCVATPPST